MYLWMILSDISYHFHSQEAESVYDNDTYCQAAIAGDSCSDLT